MATFVAVLISIPLGALAAIKQDTWVDYFVRYFLDRRAFHSVFLARHRYHSCLCHLFSLAAAADVYFLLG